MASKTITSITDDLDGAEGAETVKFALYGANYEIDLTPENQKGLEAALEPFLKAGRKVGAGRAAAKATGSSADRGYDLADLRVWAEKEGVQLPKRGRIPNTVVEQYKAR